MYKYSEYIDREVVKETRKAYLVKQEINNRRDGTHIKFKWVAKSICKPSEQQALIDALPVEILDKLNMKIVSVPEWAVSEGRW